MNMKLIILFLLVTITNSYAAELRFDKHGRMMQPDQAYLEQGAKDQSQGYENDAMRNFKNAAKFGNPYAQSAIGFIHMQNDDYITALAWFRLVDLKLIDKDEIIIKLTAELEGNLDKEELQKSGQLQLEISKEYGKLAAIKHREKWQKNISIGGTRLKGRVPARAKIYSSARIETTGGRYEIFASSSFVTGEMAMRQMNEFVYEYELKFTHGEVHLKDVEFEESEKLI